METDPLLNRGSPSYPPASPPRRVHVYGPPERTRKTNAVRTAKYNFATFFFVVLFEQFLKLANVYFLIISALQVIPGLSPTGRFTTLFPLLIVLSISIIKEFVEDVKRHRDDAAINNKKALVLAAYGAGWTEVCWRQIRVGDVLLLKDGDAVPCDAVVLNTAEPNGTAFVETSQLDGSGARE